MEYQKKKLNPIYTDRESKAIAGGPTRPGPIAGRGILGYWGFPTALWLSLAAVSCLGGKNSSMFRFLCIPCLRAWLALAMMVARWERIQSSRASKVGLARMCCSMVGKNRVRSTGATSCRSAYNSLSSCCNISCRTRDLSFRSRPCRSSFRLAARTSPQGFGRHRCRRYTFWLWPCCIR